MADKQISEKRGAVLVPRRGSADANLHLLRDGEDLEAYFERLHQIEQEKNSDISDGLSSLNSSPAKSSVSAQTTIFSDAVSRASSVTTISEGEQQHFSPSDLAKDTTIDPVELRISRIHGRVEHVAPAREPHTPIRRLGASGRAKRTADALESGEIFERPKHQKIARTGKETASVSGSVEAFNSRARGFQLIAEGHPLAAPYRERRIGRPQSGLVQEHRLAPQAAQNSSGTTSARSTKSLPQAVEDRHDDGLSRPQSDQHQASNKRSEKRGKVLEALARGDPTAEGLKKEYDAQFGDRRGRSRDDGRGL